MKKLLAVCFAVACSQVQAAPTYDAASDFSFASNPNGVWSYGYETSIGGTFTGYGQTATLNSVQFWQGSADWPHVSFNPTGSDVIFASTTFRAGRVNLHPGENGEFSVIRFTAPTAGDYSLDSAFNMRSDGGTHSTDVHVLLNNVSQFSDLVTFFDDQKAFTQTFQLGMNDTLDFVVGPNGEFFGDTTELQARLEQTSNRVPEPGTLLLTAIGVGLLGIGRRRG